MFQEEWVFLKEKKEKKMIVSVIPELRISHWEKQRGDQRWPEQKQIQWRDGKEMKPG